MSHIDILKWPAERPKTFGLLKGRCQPRLSRFVIALRQPNVTIKATIAYAVPSKTSTEHRRLHFDSKISSTRAPCRKALTAYAVPALAHRQLHLNCTHMHMRPRCSGKTTANEVPLIAHRRQRMYKQMAVSWLHFQC